MLAKQAWRLVSVPNSLLARTLKAKYYKETTFLSSKNGRYPSLTWRGLIWSRSLLQKGLRWNIGNGASIKALSDPWLPRPKTFKLLTVNSNSSLHVSDIILPNRTWNKELIGYTFEDIDFQLIRNIPLSRIPRQDRLIWHYSKSGCYTIRSGYNLAISSLDYVEQSNASHIVSWWKFFWKLNIPPKIKIFGWKAFHELLPTSMGYYKRSIIPSPLCIRCHSQAEDVLHALIKCPHSYKIWRMTDLGTTIFSKPLNVFSNYMWSLKESLSAPLFELFLVICWAIWSERNQILHGMIPRPSNSIIHSVFSLMEEFKFARNSILPNSIKAPAYNFKWTHPTQPDLKLNINASISLATHRMGVGAVIRDHKGFPKGSLAMSLAFSPSSVEVEALAFFIGLQWVIEINIQINMIETDSLNLIQTLDSNSINFSSLGSIVEDILNLLTSRPYIKYSYISRKANLVAHNLAQFGLSTDQANVWLDEIPPIDSVSAAIFKELNI